MLNVSLFAALALSAAGDDLSGPIASIRQVGPNSKGSSQAAKAWEALSQAEVGQIPVLLAGMDGASPLAHNWLRSALDRVIEKARSEKKALPKAEIEQFLNDTKHDAQARRLAYELLLAEDAGVADRLVPKWLDDPSPELRREAVARVLDEADKAFQTEKKDASLPLYRKAFSAARDKDQIDRSVRRLRELGQKVDLAAHLGMILDWKLLGPFANKDREGIKAVFPPEKGVDLAGEFDGKKGKVKWVDFLAKDELGIVNLNEGVGDDTEAVAFALTEFEVPKERDVEIRLGCFTVFKLWLNGELLLDRGDAYAGMRLDHYTTKAHLKAGKNQILLKLCQDVPPEPLPKIWRFQLRVCDSAGVAILSTTRPAYIPPERKPMTK